MKRTFTSIASIFILFTACKKEDSLEKAPTAYIEIRFHPEIDGAPLQLDVPYYNGFGEPLTVSTLKFYTGQFALGVQQSGLSVVTGGEPYYLSDASHEGSLSFTIPVKPGTYDQLSFQIGIDSARNVSGVQDNALDPVHGMFWTWNSGYIFLKMEGYSPLSTEPNGKYEYHIGGFRSPGSAIRKYVANLPAPDQWKLGIDKKISFDISFSVNAFFSAAHPLHIAETPACTTPGELASDIADNIVRSFEVTNYQIQ